MAQTVIGFFDEASEAQQAVEKLQSAGIGRDRVDVSRGNSSSGSGSPSSSADVNPVSGSPRDENSVSRTADDRTVDREGRNTNVFTDFFNNLFGGNDDNDDANRYSNVAQRSNSIVTVHAQSREEAERAAEILDDCGAIDVDERSASFGHSSSDRSVNTDLTSGSQGNLNMGKQAGEEGGLRMRSRIVERPVEDHLRLRDGRTDTDGNPLDRPSSSTDDARSF